MTYSKGVYKFESLTEEWVVFRWMWACLTDTSLLGRIVLTWRIWMKCPPERYFESSTKASKT